MNRIVDAVRTVFWSLVGLVVDDGFLAVGALVVIAVVAALADDRLLGTGDGTGWVLVLLVAAITTTSVLRAVRSANRAVGADG
ncbi:MAG: hypothetical protein AAF531_08950 [Actinomycetota bacterium]